jgi:hypothetical protein
MPKSNAEKLRDFKERQRQSGKVSVEVWIDKSKKHQLKQIAAHLNNAK